MDVHTTDKDGQKIEFLDRRRPENKNKALFKSLEMRNLGIYYRIGEQHFVSDTTNSKLTVGDPGDILNQRFALDTAGMINEYKNHYLLLPVELSVQMEQLSVPLAA